MLEELYEFLYNYELIEPEDWKIEQFAGQFIITIQNLCTLIIFSTPYQKSYIISLYFAKKTVLDHLTRKGSKISGRI